MPHKIIQQSGYIEVQVSGKMDHWDILKIIHHLHRNDPRKETPDLWILDPECDFSFHSFPMIVQGVLRLVAKTIKKGCRSAILAADEFQRVKVDLYCAEATVLPYEIRTFTARDEAVDWLCK